jgi:putative ATPase
VELFETGEQEEEVEVAPRAAPAQGSLARPPLAERMRPSADEEVVGHARLAGPGGLLARARAAGSCPSVILWGPPGCGKTTVARILARATGLVFVPFSAVTNGVKEVRDVVAAAKHRLKSDGRPTLLFVDEIHRFNKAQQDAFLPHVEAGTIVLVGATTENPSFALNAALLSRVQVEVLAPLGEADLVTLLRRALTDRDRGLGPLGVTAEAPVLERLAALGRGDARTALGALEAAAGLAGPRGAITDAVVDQAVAATLLRHDKRGDAHYDVVSALIKSLRGSDPDAALYWLARLLEVGDDPRFIARRLVIFASEDVGNADPRALTLAVAAAQAVELVGLPEARINLGQAVTFLALCPKSNASYLGIDAALEAVRRHGTLPVPHHLRNSPTGLLKALGHGANYEYPHDLPGGIGSQRYLPDDLQDARFYGPTDRGLEKDMQARLAHMRELRRGRTSDKRPT